MNDKFDLEKFKNGEPAFVIDTYALYYVGYKKNGNVVAEEESGRLVAVEHNDLAHLTMKPILKKVDLSKLPVDTVCDVNGERKHFYRVAMCGTPLFYTAGQSSRTVKEYGNESIAAGRSIDKINICDNQPWTVWFGGERPIPVGLEYEITFRDGGRLTMSDIKVPIVWYHVNRSIDIIAYRLTGKVLGGWTL